jgi:hypothetical protein
MFNPQTLGTRLECGWLSKTLTFDHFPVDSTSHLQHTILQTIRTLASTFKTHNTAYSNLRFLNLRNRCFRSSKKSHTFSISAKLSSLLLSSCLVSPGGSSEAFNSKRVPVLQASKQYIWNSIQKAQGKKKERSSNQKRFLYVQVQ